MRKILWAAVMLMALTACKNSVKESAGMIDLPRSETPDSVAKAMEDFFQAAANDSMDIHSVMIVKNAVIAITSNVEDLQGELNLVWSRILPVL